MKPIIDPDMLEALRLTRAGRLIEATALLQRRLAGNVPDTDTRPHEVPTNADAPTGDEPRIVEGTHDRVETPRLPQPLLRKPFLGDPPHKAAEAQDVEPESPTIPHPTTLATIFPVISRIVPKNGLGLTLAKMRRLGASFGSPAGGLTAERSLEIPPATLPPGAQFLTASYTNEAGTRAYKLYVPSDYKGQPLPLIVMLHGCTQSPDDFAAGTRMNVVAEEHDCFVAYPAQSPTANRSKCWNWFKPSDQQRGRGEPSLIAGIVSQIGGAYAIDPQRVYSAGLSAGGAAAVVLGETYPDIFAAVGVHSGLPTDAASDIPSAFAAMHQGPPQMSRKAKKSTHWTGLSGTRPIIPTIVFHGDKDRTVHPRNGAEIIARSSASSHSDLRVKSERGEASGRSYRRTRHCDASGGAVLEMWIVHGAGHTWSGGSSQGSFTDPSGPDASREMVRFFLEHPKKGSNATALAKASD